MQALVKIIPVLGGVARINRGPAFFEHPVSSAEIEASFYAVRRLAVRSGWRLVAIAPNLPSAQSLHEAIGRAGFWRRKMPGASSAVLDLVLDEQVIYESLHSKWRNLLRKADRQSWTLENSADLAGVDFLVARYEASQREKGYVGVQSAIVREIAAARGPAWDYSLLFARKDEAREGAIMTVGHGDTCTYLIGWTSTRGREGLANYYLLWQAILRAKSRGYRYFDVGGLGINTTSGVGHFKRGLRGREYSLLGDYLLLNLRPRAGHR